MNNKEFIVELSQCSGYTQDNVQKLVKCIVDAMASCFDEAITVAVPGFGVFEVKNRMERIVVNPSTGQRMMVPPKLVLVFKADTAVKDAVKKSQEAENAKVDLCKNMMEKYGLTRDAAQHFLDLMFSVVNDGLKSSKMVKVKSLGTFKVGLSGRGAEHHEANDRVEADVNGKIVFTPDIVLRERVNRPFEQFKTVVLNDGVDFSSLGTESTPDVRDEDSDIDPSYADGNADSDADSDADADVDTDAGADIDTDSDAAVSTVAQASTMANTGNTENMNADMESSAFRISSLHVSNMHVDHMSHGGDLDGSVQDVSTTLPAGNVAQTANGGKNVKAEQADKNVPHPSASVDEVVKLKDELFALSNANRKLKNECRHLGARLRCAVRLLVVVSAVMLVMVSVCVWGTVKYFSQMEMEKTRIANLQKDYDLLASRFSNISSQLAQDDKTLSANVLNSVTGSQQAGDNVGNKHEAGKKSANAPVLTPSASTGKEVSSIQYQSKSQTHSADAKASAQKKTEQAEKATSYDSDPRIRTGAYRIIGIDRTVTLQKGQTLESVSRAYLGKGMECYVEAVNKKNVSVGDKVNIPKLQHKKKR